jgi:hypothetical protein
MDWGWVVLALLLFFLFCDNGDNDEEDEDETDVEGKRTMDKKEFQKLLDETVRMSKEALTKNGLTGSEQAVVALTGMLLQQILSEYSDFGEMLLAEDDQYGQ